MTQKSNADILNDILQLGRDATIAGKDETQANFKSEGFSLIKDPLVEKQALEEYELEQI